MTTTRRIQTIFTSVLTIEGAIGAGDVQWMTAGSGIIDLEMPRVAFEEYQGGTFVNVSTILTAPFP